MTTTNQTWQTKTVKAADGVSRATTRRRVVDDSGIAPPVFAGHDPRGSADYRVRVGLAQPWAGGRSVWVLSAGAVRHLRADSGEFEASLTSYLAGHGIDWDGKGWRVGGESLPLSTAGVGSDGVIRITHDVAGGFGHRAWEIVDHTAAADLLDLLAEDGRIV